MVDDVAGVDEQVPGVGPLATEVETCLLGVVVEEMQCA
jgi:hypothetical protein